MRIEETVAIVTGGASGLGEACARNLIANGGRVAILDITDDRGGKLAAELGPDAIYINTDVTSEEGLKRSIQKALASFGKINVAISCAGVVSPGKVLSKSGPMSLGFFNKVIQVNLVGTFNLTRLAVEQMVKNRSTNDGETGVIINTASVAAFEGQIGQAAYSGSKAGVAGMTLPIARECAEYGIRVMTIAPGLFETPMMAGLPPDVRNALQKMVPFPKRMGKPEEFAKLVQHIIENPMLNGEVIRLDGAIRMAAR